MLYALVFTIGLSNGYKELVGIYSSMEELEKGKENISKSFYV